MIRMIFVFFVALGGFATAALWNARGVDPRRVVEEAVPEAVRAAVEAEAARFALDVTEMLPDPGPEREPARTAGVVVEPTPAVHGAPVAPKPVPDAAEAPVEVAADTPVEVEDPGDAPVEVEVAADAPVEVEEAADAPVEVEDLEPLRDFAIDVAAVSDGLGGAGVVDDGDDPESVVPVSAVGLAQEPPLDESAALIRRMLSVYRRAGARE